MDKHTLARVFRISLPCANNLTYALESSGLTQNEEACDLLSRPPSYREYGKYIYDWYRELPPMVKSTIHENATRLVLEARLSQNHDSVPGSINTLAPEMLLAQINLELRKKKIVCDYIKTAIQNELSKYEKSDDDVDVQSEDDVDVDVQSDDGVAVQSNDGVESEAVFYD